MIYLAAPYTHHDPAVVMERMSIFCKVDGYLCKNGYITVSPLSKHWMKDHTDIPLTWEFWKTYSEELMKRCSALYIITAPGWEESVGVLGEIELAEEMGLEIKYLDYLEIIEKG